MSVTNPMSINSDAVFEKEIKTERIISLYKKQFDIDVSRYFVNIESINIYRCSRTGYRFYHPFTTSGDGQFYEDLEKFPWYYMDWKWEHEIVSSLINSGNTILEIGCARGGFLKNIQDKCKRCVGLELNKNAADIGLAKGLDIRTESIEDFSNNHENEFDIVCSFQVVEHIYDISKFLDSSIKCLKAGGKLIISVPNNDSLIFQCNDDIVLNMPPHHMGLWNIHSLIKLQELYPIKLVDIALEPLQDYHIGFAYNLVQNEIVSKSVNKLGFIGKYLDRKINDKKLSVMRRSIMGVREHIIGHTIVAVYEKE